MPNNRILLQIGIAAIFSYPVNVKTVVVFPTHFLGNGQGAGISCPGNKNPFYMVINSIQQNINALQRQAVI